MKYSFQQLGNESCRKIAASIPDLLIGKFAVNTAFDSGHIHRPDWEHVNGFPVTPSITQDFIAEWPISHDQYCDEWWIFDQTVPSNFDVRSFCNFIGTPISDYKQLDWDGGCPLDFYLQQFKPIAVFGNNELGYLITS